MTLSLMAALFAGLGTYLLITKASKRTAGRDRTFVALGQRFQDVMMRSGIETTGQRRFLATVAAACAGGFVVGWLLFGGVVAPLGLGIFVATFPLASVHNKARALSRESAAAWPQLIEEMRLLCASLGRPIPQALIEVGANAPDAMKPAFAAAEREWRITTDFERMTATLKQRLADPTADVVCETLLIAHSLGGSDLQRRLRTLAADRQVDLDARKDAVAKQAGVRFARKFVLIVPAGMALAGMSIGTGREAYSSAGGQLGVLVALGTLAACWFWAGRLIKLPETERVFRD